MPLVFSATSSGRAEVAEALGAWLGAVGRKWHRSPGPVLSALGLAVAEVDANSRHVPRLSGDLSVAILKGRKPS